jgi:hypothetical protein
MNNPGNIRVCPNGRDPWQGLMPRASMTPEQAAEHEFVVFASPKWGFRAMGIILLNYARAHHLNTERARISRWAPPNENDTEAYVQAVSRYVGLSADTVADFTKPDLLTAEVHAISVHECGGWLFKDADLNAGISLAEIN